MVIVRLRVRYGPAANRQVDVTAVRATAGAALACALVVAVRVTATPLAEFLRHVRVERVAERMRLRPPRVLPHVHLHVPGVGLSRLWRTAVVRGRRW